MKVVFFLLALVLASCAGTPRAADETTPPLWVTDTDLVYPDGLWLITVERGDNARTAERAAVTALSQIFRVDLNSVTVANDQFVQAVENVQGKAVIISSESIEIAQELVSVSVVSGLIGLQVDSWTAPDGRAYANARMNRLESAARYTAMIQENERVINQLIEEAQQHQGTFEAYQILNLAYNFAQVTDNFQSLLSVLDPFAVSRRLSYGNAEAVRSLVLSAGRAIIITVEVNGDRNGRITRAFTESLNSRGFRTATGGANPYILAASFELEDADMNSPTYEFVRYILHGSLRNIAGVELFSFSENRRAGQRNESEAIQRAIRAAEESIGSTGFAENFDAFLASLL